MEKRYSFFSLILTVLIKVGSCGNLNLTEYYKMPILNFLEDYDRCFAESPESNPTYCFVDVTIKPNTSNIAWNAIAAFNKNYPLNFHHDRLQRGICVNRCKERFKNFVEGAQTKWYQPLDFEANSSYFLYDKSEVYEDPKYYQDKYGQIINQCVNIELKTKHDLMAYSVVDYCDKKTMFGYGYDFGIDFWDCLFVFIVIVILVFAILSSVYDYRRKQQAPDSTNNEHYRNQPTDKRTQILLSFSIYRNFFRMQGPKSKEAAMNQRDAKGNIVIDELKIINACRFVFMFLVLLGHTVLLMIAFPTGNPVYLEQKLQELPTQIFVGGAMIIQCFLTISGFLLAWKFLEHLDKGNKPKFADLFKGIVIRWLRLTPIYAFIILLHSTWLIKLQDGPVWRRVAQAERSFCRKSWWTNLLYVNNYIRPNHSCVQEGWYLGCEFQLFIVSLFSLIVVTKYPRTKFWFLGIGIMLAFIPQIIITYMYHFQPLLNVSLEISKYIFMFSDSYRMSYVPGHTNLGGYLYGVIGGWFWFYVKKEKIDLAKKWPWLKTYVQLIFPLGFLFVASCAIFIINKIEHPSLINAVYSGFAKNVLGFLCACLIIGVSSGAGGYLNDLLNHRGFNLLGRITFCVYLIHSLVIRATMGNMRNAVYSTDAFVLVSLMSTLFLSYLAGCFLCLLIEIPFSNLVKIFTTGKTKTSDKSKEAEPPLELRIHTVA